MPQVLSEIVEVVTVVDSGCEQIVDGSCSTVVEESVLAFSFRNALNNNKEQNADVPVTKVTEFVVDVVKVREAVRHCSRSTAYLETVLVTRLVPSSGPVSVDVPVLLSAEVILVGAFTALWFNLFGLSRALDCR